MSAPQGKELEEIRARRQKLREKYLKRRGERPASTVQGVHHVALICKDLGLEPDWDLLAGEYWAQAEIARGNHRPTWPPPPLFAVLP